MKIILSYNVKLLYPKLFLHEPLFTTWNNSVGNGLKNV